MVKSKVTAGICGFVTNISAASDDMQFVELNIDSDCPNITKLSKDFPKIDGYQEISDGFEGVIHKRANETLRGCCSGCIVPSAIFKSMQVAAGLALPAESKIEIEKA